MSITFDVVTNQQLLQSHIHASQLDFYSCILTFIFTAVNIIIALMLIMNIITDHSILKFVILNTMKINNDIGNTIYSYT